MKALKPGKYSVFFKFIYVSKPSGTLYNFFVGNGTHRLMSGSSIDISADIALIEVK